MDRTPIRVGDTVLVQHKHRAIVRYVGQTAFSEGLWFGLELEREIGKHEGTVLGQTYFVSPKKRGTFMKREALSLFDPHEQAASSIQSVARMHSGKKRFGVEVSWRTFNALDADEEAQHLARQARLQNTELGLHLARERASIAELETWERRAGAPAAAATEELAEPGAAALAFPLTEAGVLAMMASFKEGRPLRYGHAMRLVGEFRRWAAVQPTLGEVTVAAGERLTVCGDLHGQLKDLFSIYALNGTPSRSNRYLMNGDFIDRGECGCEVLFTLMAWCLLYPPAPGASPACLLNRGNHETHAQNVTGGFMREVFAKYGRVDSPPLTPTQATAAAAATAAGAPASAEASSTSLSAAAAATAATAAAAAAAPRHIDRGARLYDAIQAAFECLPLATLICKGERRIFVVHGGLLHRPGVTLAQIGAIQRRREIPYGLQGFEDRLFEDLMWSDPRPIADTSPSDRGAGVFFGGDVTDAFCALNRVSLVVRSHECVPEGFLYTHGSRLVTVFSASKYCGRGTNKGAFLLFDAELQHSVRQFMAPDLELTAPSPVPPPTADAALAALYGASTLDGDDFDVPAAPARAGAGAVLVAPVTTPLLAAAAAPLDMPSLASSSAAAAMAQDDSNRNLLVERICLRKPDLYFFYSAADNTGARDGRISKLAWADGMRNVLDIELPWLKLCPSLCEIEADGRISYSRFLDRYRIAMRDSDLSWMEAITERVCEQLFRVSSTLEESFKAWDEDSDGVIELEELQKGLMRANLDLSKAQVYEIMRSIDTDRDGRIQLAEFVDRFKLSFSHVRERAATAAVAAAAHVPGLASAGAGSPPAAVLQVDDWATAALVRVGEALFSMSARGQSIVSVFSAMDLNGDGVLSKAEFTSALAALQLDFSDAEMLRIMDVVDTNRSGSINYIEFCSAFRFHDSRSGPLRGQLTTWSRQSGEASSASAAAAASAGLVASAAAVQPAWSVAGEVDRAGGAVAWQRGLIEKIVAVLFEYRFELAAAFSMFDTDHSGKISRDEFRVGLGAIASLTGSPLTEGQADELMRALDTNGDGEIDYAEFVDAFRLVDTRGGTRVPGSDLKRPPLPSSAKKA